MAHTTGHTRFRMKQYFEAEQQRFKDGDRESEPTYAEVAREFNVSYDQAYNACTGKTTAKKGKKSKTKGSRRPSKSSVEKENRDIFQLYTHEHKATLLQMERDKNLSVNDRVKMLTTLAEGMYKMQRVELEHHLKRVDANVVARLVRMFEPGATQTDVVKYYKEASELVRIEEAEK